MSCQCKLCSRTREFRTKLEAVPEQEREFWSNMYEYLCETEADRDYYKAVVEGTWPTADEVIKNHRKTDDTQSSL